ncbi:MAG: hypothetical protein PWQ50_403 [Methanolobus sp.]|jgi:hypothetical protein|nr:hypothetical protein [Methanolobus sp.]
MTNLFSSSMTYFLMKIALITGDLMLIMTTQYLVLVEGRKHII